MATAAATAVSGISSGIDWRATVDSLMQIERQRVNALERNKAETRSQMAAWRDLSDSYSTLQDLMDSYSDVNSFLTKAVSTSDEDVLTAVARTSAVTGNYSVTVNQLATASSMIHSGFSDLNTTAINSSGGSQQFVYSLGIGDDLETVTLEVSDGATLSVLKDLINRDTNNPGVRASIINDGSGSPTAYHLVLTSDETGSESVLAIDDALTTLGDGSSFDTAAFPDSNTGVNAQVRINGYPSGSWIESQSNDVEDVIDGVTLKLKDLTAGSPINMTVNQDEATVRGKVDNFVNSYNSIMDKISALGSYDSEKETRGLLFGNSAMQQMKRSLQTLTNRNFAGIPTSNAYSSLSQIGLTSGSGGKLSVDEDKLDAALTDNFNDVGELFAFTGTSDSNAIKYFSRANSTEGGSIAVQVSYAADGSIAAASINGKTAQIENSFVLGAVDSEYEGLRLIFTDPEDGGGTINATVNLSMGASASFIQVLDAITNEDTGSLQFQTDMLDDSVDRLQKSIDAQEARLIQIRAKYEREFIAMEISISNYNTQGNYLSSQLSRL